VPDERLALLLPDRLAVEREHLHIHAS
jgi:hypothetical protein